MTSLAWLLLGPLLACADGDTDTDAPPPITDGTNTETCGGTEPVADDLTISNGGLGNFEGEDAPTIRLSLHLTDEDGDIHQGTMEVWYDETLDDQVDTSGDPDTERLYSNIGDACFTDAATLNLSIRVGTVFDYNTPYEFGVLFVDADGLPSNVLVASGVTPKENGEDGDPVE